jgi:axial budding pattern protein 2
VVVSNYSAPTTHAGFTSQIADPSARSFSSVTAMPSDTGVQVPPYWSFSLGWQWDTFRMARNNSNGNLYTAARLRGTASLPTWLNFDNSSMTFTGVAPADGNYWITVTGTDYWGYTAAQSSFAISVGQGEALELTGSGARTVGEMTGMARNKAEGQVDITNVTIAGQAAQAAQLNMRVAGDFGDWLSIEGYVYQGG